MSSEDTSNIYVHKSKQVITSNIYLNECINARLLSFIKQHHRNDNFVFWLDNASAHYGNIVLDKLKEKNVPFVSRLNNPPNVPRAHPIETVWSILEQKVYAHDWEAKNLDLLSRRIKLKAKELDQKMLQAMIQDIRKHLRCMWRNDLFSICQCDFFVFLNILLQIKKT